MSAPILRPYQRDTQDAIWCAYQKGANRILIQKATGLGKTVTFASLPKHPQIAAWLAQFAERDRRMLVLAHREELIQQAAEKLHHANPDLYIGVEQGDVAAAPFSDVVIASVQTLAAKNYRRLDKLLARRPFRIVVVDEAHHAAAGTYRNCLMRLGFLPQTEEGADDEDLPDAATLAEALRAWETVAPKDRILVGVTATPNRTDSVGLGCVFQTIAYTYPIKRAIDDQWLAPITPWSVDSATDLGDVAVRRGEFDARQLSKAVNTEDRNRIAVAAWLEKAKGRQTIAFTVDVAHAHAVAQAFTDAGIWANAISGETPKEMRRQLLKDYSAGKFPVLTNCMVLTEGTDLPATSCILHLKPTRSATLYEQMTGRGLRLHPGKVDCVVIDVVDIARQHSLQTAPVLYGLPPLKPEGKSLKEVADALEALQQDYPLLDVEKVLAAAGGRMTLEQLRAKATAFDVWTVPELGADGEGLSLAWIKVGQGVYRIQYPWGDGTEVMKVERTVLGRFDVSVTLRSDVGVRQRTVAADVDSARAALRIAESFVQMERRIVTRLKDKDAFWRKRPASPKQLKLLSRRRIPFRRGLTMGEASELIDIANARRGR